ncbi:hypothetical protein, partial [Stenotrophomonas sp. YIM B06876]|uniref:hypothetical protein n=1 Tax=Stenotrophomonas sp. YIM B06876 TaxID=3060211 RepID=UPI0027385D89
TMALEVLSFNMGLSSLQMRRKLAGTRRGPAILRGRALEQRQVSVNPPPTWRSARRLGWLQERGPKTGSGSFFLLTKTGVRVNIHC